MSVSPAPPGTVHSAMDDSALGAYRRDGFVVLRGLLGEAELAMLRAASDRVLADAVRYGRELDAQRPVELRADHGFHDWDEIDDRFFLYARDSEGRRVWRRAEQMWRRDVAFRAIAANPRIVAAVERAVGAPVLPGNDSMVVKMPGAGAAVPWHRDPPGVELIRRAGDASADFVTDVYVDQSTRENGCVWALPGSHRHTEDVEPESYDRPDAVALEAQPGDVVLHSTGVLHGSPPNRSASMRRTFYVHYGSREELQVGWWKRDAAWLEERAAWFATMREERRALGLD
jgi:hypothetical protein